MDQLKIILAKYWVGILCAVIALIAIITAYIPLGGYHTTLYGKLQARAAIYSTAENLINKTREKPLIPGQTTPDPLTVFPSPSITKSGGALRDEIQAQSMKAVQVVVAINRHDPLVPGVLPNPAGVAPLEYRRAYRDRTGPTGTLYTQVLKATMPPTTDEIKAEADRIWATKYKDQIIPDGTGKSYNQDLIDQQYKAEVDMLPQKMRDDRAHTFKIYAAGDAMPIDPVVSNTTSQPPDPRKIWWSQMGLWVEEDVAKAIAEANTVDSTGKATPDVTTAAIKRLVKLDIAGNGDQGMLFTAVKNVSTAAPVPAAAPADPSAPILLADSTTPVPLDNRVSPTGRVSCPMYDVVQFRVEMVVAAKDIPWIADCFARNRLMSVLNIESIVTEDINAATLAGFTYGPDPVVHITLKCEALYLREWTIPLMPDTVKRLLVANAAAPAQ